MGVILWKGKLDILTCDNGHYFVKILLDGRQYVELKEINALRILYAALNNYTKWLFSDETSVYRIKSTHFQTFYLGI